MSTRTPTTVPLQRVSELAHWKGYAVLYRYGAHHFVVSTIHEDDRSYLETMVFHADPDGAVTNWVEVLTSIDREDAILSLNDWCDKHLSRPTKLGTTVTEAFSLGVNLLHKTDAHQHLVTIGGNWTRAWRLSDAEWSELNLALWTTFSACRLA